MPRTQIDGDFIEDRTVTIDDIGTTGDATAADYIMMSIGGSGTTADWVIVPDNITWSASRNKKATNIYLWTDDVQPTNVTPYILPWNAKLVAISVSTEIPQTWTAEIHSGGTLIPGASLSISASSAGYSIYDIVLSAGDEIEIYASGVNIEKPRVSVTFRRI